MLINQPLIGNTAGSPQTGGNLLTQAFCIGNPNIYCKETDLYANGCYAIQIDETTQAGPVLWKYQTSNNKWTNLGTLAQSVYSGIVAPTPIDLNTTADQILNVANGGGTFAITTYAAFQASINLTMVDDVEVWTGPGRTGVQLLSVASGTSTIQGGWGDLTTPENLITGLLPRSYAFTGSKLYLSVGTPQGAAAIALFGLAGFQF